MKKKKQFLILGGILILIMGTCLGYYYHVKNSEENLVDDTIVDNNMNQNESNSTADVILNIGEIRKLEDLLENTNNQEISSYTIDNEGILEIDETHNITALQEGLVNLTVTYSDASIENISFAVTTTTSNATISSTDRVYFLSLRRGNAILFQSTDKNGKKIYGLLDAGNDNSGNVCPKLVDEIKSIIGKTGKLDFLMISHLDVDHVGCAPTVLQNIATTNLYLKYYNNIVGSSVQSQYNATVKAATARGTKVNLLKNDKYTAKNNPTYLVDANGKKITSSALSIRNRNDDWNKSYAKLTFGKFDFLIMNIVQRRESGKASTVTTAENFNSLAVYATVNGYKLYFPGDLENISYKGNSSYKYNNALYTTVTNKEYNLADFYTAWLSYFTSGKPIDLYVTAHHGTPVGTDQYIAKKIISSNTKVVFTFAYNGFIDAYSHGSKKSTSYSCGSYTNQTNGRAEKFRCLNDITVNRIIYTLNNGNPVQNVSSVSIYYQNNFSKKASTDASTVLRFGFNNASITSAGGTKVTQKYKSNILN